MENKSNLERDVMATITKEEIITLATLSRLAIHEDELPQLQQHVAQVLDYARCVADVAHDVTEIIPTQTNVFRDDVAISVDTQQIMAQAPEREGNYFVVPRILDHTE